MKPDPYPYLEKTSLSLSEKFHRRNLPNGRQVVQLTSGDAFCYPLYYFIPSFSGDLKYLVYHRAEANEVQLYRLDLESGKSVQLTHGKVKRTGWDNWDDDAGSGILDHRSVLNVARGEVVYFGGENGEEACLVNLETLEGKSLFCLPGGYYAGGQNCISPDGNYFVYIINPVGSKYLEPLPGRSSKVMAYDLNTGQQKTLCEVSFHIHHVIPYGNEHFMVCHTPNGVGVFMTSLATGGCTVLRVGDPGLLVKEDDKGGAGHACHFATTRQGLVYEVVPVGDGGYFSGLYDPSTRARFEFPLPSALPTHVGWDPEGRRWFWEVASASEQSTPDCHSTPDKTSPHRLVYLRSIDPSGEAEFVDLTCNWKTYGSKQKAHFHPQITPDPNWLLFVTGDPESETNHLFLLDVSDLPATEGVGRELLSPEGANDIAQLRE